MRRSTRDTERFEYALKDKLGAEYEQAHRLLESYPDYRQKLTNLFITATRDGDGKVKKTLSVLEQYRERFQKEEVVTNDGINSVDDLLLKIYRTIIW